MTLERPVTISLVEPASDESVWLPQVRRLHLSALSDGIVARLGDHFIDGYYRAMVRDTEGCLWVAWHQGRIVGFLGGTLNRLRFHRDHRVGAAQWRILLGVARLRISPLLILRALRKTLITRGLRDRSELLTIAVDALMRRGGVGAALLRAWHEHLLAGGERSYVVFTDNDQGRRFYEKHRGECLFQFSLAGRSSAGFRMRVDDDVQVDRGQV